MKKWICLLLTALLIPLLVSCGSSKTEEKTETKPEEKTETVEWTRAGYFQDENENMISITWMDDIDELGCYVGCMIGEDMIEDSWGGTLAQEGSTLHGTLTSSGSKDDLTVTVSEEGEDGLLLAVDGGESYHFAPFDMPDASIFITINTDGMGNIEYAEGEETARNLTPSILCSLRGSICWVRQLHIHFLPGRRRAVRS